LYHRGIRGNVSRSAVADANERRDWRIYADLASIDSHPLVPCMPTRTWCLILTTRFMRSMPLPSTCACPSFRGHCFAQPNLLSSSRPCSIFKATSQPCIHISDGKPHDVNILDLLIPEPGAFYIPAPSTSWIVATWTSSACSRCTEQRAFLRHPRQVQYQIQASLLSARGRIRWCSMRSDHCAEWSQVRA